MSDINTLNTAEQKLQTNANYSPDTKVLRSSSLLIAGDESNFIYKITKVDFSLKEIEAINSISSRTKLKDRILSIKAKGGRLDFIKTQRPIFSNNLILIDSLLPQILSSLLLSYYSTTHSSTEALVKILEVENPMGLDMSGKHEFYRYKIKRFLTDVALDMTPSKVWSGKYSATGGYLIVKDDGDILCYHVYNKNEFENYLLANTKLETASSTRHKFGFIYEEAGELYFNLNLQIRFK